jgi:hypothetical protein
MLHTSAVSMECIFERAATTFMLALQQSVTHAHYDSTHVVRTADDLEYSVKCNSFTLTLTHSIYCVYNCRYVYCKLLYTTGAHSLANAGFARPFQLINVEDFQGHGETAPTAHFYQVLATAYTTLLITALCSYHFSYDSLC